MTARSQTTTKTTTIWDPTAGRTREVKDIRIVLYDSGAVVEFIVVGRTHEWPMFIALDKFREVNPNVTLTESE